MPHGGTTYLLTCCMRRGLVYSTLVIHFLTPVSHYCTFCLAIRNADIHERQDLAQVISLALVCATSCDCFQHCSAWDYGLRCFEMGRLGLQRA